MSDQWVESENPKIAALLGAPAASIYFIQAGTDGAIKIGRALDVKKRMKALQIGNAARLRLLRVILCLDAEEAERNLHERYADYRLRGEWFSPDAEILEDIELAEGEELARPTDHAQCAICMEYSAPWTFDLCAHDPDDQPICDACVRDGEPVAGHFAPCPAE